MDVPQTAVIEKEAQSALTVAKDFKIVSNEHYTVAAERLKTLKGLMKQVADTFDPIIRKAHDAHKEAVAQRKKHEQPLIEAEGIYKRSMLMYTQEQERQRQEQERKAREAAEREQAKLREQAAAAEAKAKAESERLRKEAEEAAAAGRAEEAAKLAAKAQTAEDKGAAKAEGLKDRADLVPTPVIASNTPVVSGISTRKTYAAKVTDKMALIKAVAEGRAPDNVLEANQTVLNALARSMKEGFSYPGVELVTETGIASKAS